MSPDETERKPPKQAPALLWFGLGVLLVAAFAAVAFLLGGPSGGLPKVEPPSNRADQAVLAAPEPKASKLD